MLFNLSPVLRFLLPLSSIEDGAANEPAPPSTQQIPPDPPHPPPPPDPLASTHTMSLLPAIAPLLEEIAVPQLAHGGVQRQRPQALVDEGTHAGAPAGGAQSPLLLEAPSVAAVILQHACMLVCLILECRHLRLVKNQDDMRGRVLGHAQPVRRALWGSRPLQEKIDLPHKHLLKPKEDATLPREALGGHRSHAVLAVYFRMLREGSVLEGKKGRKESGGADAQAVLLPGGHYLQQTQDHCEQALAPANKAPTPP